ncbi:MAG: hypothetical protein LBU32_05295 [Clostridiales bacterium]|jgi:hypothetical protein|nr:hypothetical protein [Clostridiales bacterium]
MKEYERNGRRIASLATFKKRWWVVFAALPFFLLLPVFWLGPIVAFRMILHGSIEAGARSAVEYATIFALCFPVAYIWHLPVKHLAYTFVLELPGKRERIMQLRAKARFWSRLGVFLYALLSLLGAYAIIQYLS